MVKTYTTREWNQKTKLCIYEKYTKHILHCVIQLNEPCTRQTLFALNIRQHGALTENEKHFVSVGPANVQCLECTKFYVPMKDFDSDISASWHVARENESVGLHAVSYCTI